MSSTLTTRAGTCLHDSDMKLWDHRNKKSISVDWSKKDKKLEQILPALKQKAGSFDIYTTHIIPENTPISDQKHAGSCVAQAWCDMLEIVDGLEGNDNVEQLSRRFLYWTARYLTGQTNEDNGTFLRSAAHQLLKVGIIEEKYFPYNDGPDYIISGGAHASPELDIYTMASNNIKIAGFYKASSLTPESLLNELEIAIRGNHPVVFGTPVNKEFMNYRGGNVVFTAPKDNIVGGHAMIIVGVGYDGPKRWWLWRNSWSLGWGDSGHVKVDDDYILACRDIWVGTTMKELI